MASTIALKRRIASVKNTKQITKAMELVAASKMRKATEAAHSGRAYREAAHSMLARLASVVEIADHPLYTKRSVRTRLYVVITSDRGLAGAYNSNIIKLLAKNVKADREKSIKSQIIIIGKRGAQFLRRVEGVEITAAYSEFGDRPTANDIRPILNTVVEEYSRAKVDQVVVLFTEHKSNISQIAEQSVILPAEFREEATDEQGLSNRGRFFGRKRSGNFKQAPRLHRGCRSGFPCFHEFRFHVIGEWIELGFFGMYFDDISIRH
jgi:F-type H+-transporting ATPase subunit gamma